MTSFKLRVLAQVLPFLLVAPALASAQTPPSRSEAMAAMKAGQQQAGAQYTRQQIDQLIAPIALYPDQLLAQVLMAATYPQQLLEARDWLQDPQHAALKGDALAQALADLPWDPSVKALVAFPPVIAMMTEHLEWTESLGLAFATQQAQVMSRVQALRQLALKTGRIKSVKHVTVRRQGEAIEIVSAEPDRVFVPVYNPTTVYGAWPDPHYPPIYVAPPRQFVSETRAITVETVEPGIEVFSYPVVQPLWGWTRPDWRSERITIETDAYTRITRGVQPPPDHYWHREGPIVILAPAAAPPQNARVAVPAGTVAPAQAVAVGALQEQAASHSDKVRVESSVPAPRATPSQNAGASPPGAPQTGGAQTATGTPGQERGTAPPNEAQGNRGTSGNGPSAGGATPAAGGERAGKPQSEKAQAQTGTSQTQQSQTGKPQPEKAQAQTGTPQTRQPEAEKAQAQPQTGKTQTQQSQKAQPPQAEKAQAQHSQTEKAQGQPSQTEKPQAQHSQAEKAQGQQSQAEKPQAQRSQTEKAQGQQSPAERAPHPQADKTQAQQSQAHGMPHPQAEKSQSQRPQAQQQPPHPQAQQHPQAPQPQAQQPQMEKTQAQHPQAERTRSEHGRPEAGQAGTARVEQPQTAAKPQAEKAQGPSHGPANAAAPAGAAPHQAGPAANHPAAAAGETHGQGSSAPPKPAALPGGHEAAAGHQAPHPQPGAGQRNPEKREQ